MEFHKLTPDQRETFENDGFLVVPNALDAAKLKELREAGDRLNLSFIREVENHYVDTRRRTLREKAFLRLVTNPSTVIDFKHIIEEKVQNKEAVSFSAALEGKIVGYMISYIVFGGFGLEKSAWIATLGVDPEYMGQGLTEKKRPLLKYWCSEKNIEYSQHMVEITSPTCDEVQRHKSLMSFSTNTHGFRDGGGNCELAY